MAALGVAANGVIAKPSGAIAIGVGGEMAASAAALLASRSRSRNVFGALGAWHGALAA